MKKIFPVDPLFTEEDRKFVLEELEGLNPENVLV